MGPCHSAGFGQTTRPGRVNGSRVAERDSARRHLRGDDGGRFGAGSGRPSHGPGVGIVLARTERARCPRSQAATPRHPATVDLIPRAHEQLSFPSPALTSTPVRPRGTDGLPCLADIVIPGPDPGFQASRSRKHLTPGESPGVPHPRRPSRSCAGRNLTQQSGDPFTTPRRVTPSGFRRLDSPGKSRVQRPHRWILGSSRSQCERSAPPPREDVDDECMSFNS